MPIFNFKCSNCDIIFEELARLDEIVDCPTCKNKSEKLFTGCSNIKFRGDGWTPRNDINSTGAIKDHTQMFKEQRPDVAKDSYKDVKQPVFIKD